MERVNQELEQYLRLFVNEQQDDWDELLPLAEFQYNTHTHSATQQTPFMLDTGDIKTTHPSPKLTHRYLRPYISKKTLVLYLNIYTTMF